MKLKHMIKLFNTGKLTMLAAEWLHKNGWCLHCKSGQVVAIFREV